MAPLNSNLWVHFFIDWFSNYFLRWFSILLTFLVFFIFCLSMFKVASSDKGSMTFTFQHLDQTYKRKFAFLRQNKKSINSSMYDLCERPMNLIDAGYFCVSFDSLRLGLKFHFSFPLQIERRFSGVFFPWILWHFCKA